MSEKSRRHPNVVNVDEVEPAATRTASKGSRFGFTARFMGRASGGKGLGCGYYEVPPGRTAFPAHYHCANEEAIFVLEGVGTARIGDARVPVRAGDYLALPPGPGHAHQLVNTGTGVLRYLCMSTALGAEIIVYPDSGKVAAMANAPGTSWMDPPWIRGIFREKDKVDYYEGEKTGDET